MGTKERSNIDQEVIERYLNGEGNEEDRDKIEKWFSSTAHTASLRRGSFHFWENMTVDDDQLDGYDEDRILDRLNHLLRLEDAKEIQKVRRKWILLTYAGRIAAGLFVPLLIFTYLQGSGFFDDQQSLAYSSVYSPLGARTQFHLPDGSEGWLNGGSTLQFPATFSGKYRQVQLEGEAFFEVVSNPRKPFAVTTEGIKVVATGTSFNVNAYKEDSESKITLASGEVALFEQGDNDLQRPLGRLDSGFQFVWFKDLNSHISKEVDLNKIISWKEGKLVFRDDSMSEVVDRLNRWYNVDISIRDKKLQTYTFHATFQDETLDEVLKLLELSSPMKVRELGREIGKDNTFGKRRIILSSK